jgi:hypothetical protein
MMRGMASTNFNHTRLLRITGLIAYLCDGMPLFTHWATERLDLLHRPDFALLLCTLFYLVFGVMYLLVTNNLARVPTWARACWGCC